MPGMHKPLISDPGLLELEEIESALVELSARRAFVQASINARMDPFSSKFPPEIASQIFHFYIQAHKTKK
jgi:hypothetical protein